MEIIIALAFLALANTIATATALQPVDNFREGSCSGIRPRSTRVTRKFVDKLKYIPAGSRYNLYSLISALPNYSYIREDEFYYDACFSRNTTTMIDHSISGVFGFGKLLSTFWPVSRRGIYLEAIPTSRADSWNTEINIVTLTDHRCFAFLATCWRGVDQRGWTVISNKPKLDPGTEKAIEAHAVALDFKRENFVFLRQDGCRWGLGNPDLEGAGVKQPIATNVSGSGSGLCWCTSHL